MFLRLISRILSHLFLLDSYRCAWVICGNISSFIPRYAHLVDMGLTVNGSKSGTPQSIPICLLKMIKQLQNTTKTQWPMAFTSYPLALLSTTRSQVTGLEGLRGERSAARVWLAEGMPRLLYLTDQRSPVELCFFSLLNCNTQIRTPTRGLRKPLLPSKTASQAKLPTRGLPFKKCLRGCLRESCCNDLFT